MPQVKQGIGFGVSVPYVGKEESLPRLTSFAEEAEKLGFDSLWIWDSLLDDARLVLDPFEFLSYVAARTTKIRLGISALIFPVRPLAALAKDVATLDFLSSGRVTLGLGLGGDESVYSAMGVDPKKRVADYPVRIEALKALWSSDKVTFHGENWRLEGATMYPKTVQQPHPPIWIAGTSEAAMRRAARWGEGWIGRGSSTVESIGAARTTINKMLQENGRDPSEMVIAKPTFVSMGRDPQQAKTDLEKYLGRHYSVAADPEQSCLVGTPARCREMAERLASAGVDQFIFWPMSLDVEELRAIADEVVSHFERR